MHPIAFNFGRLTIHWYGILMAVAFVAGLWTAMRRAPRGGVAADKIADLVPWLILGALAGARVFYALTYWDNLMRNPLFPAAPWTEVFMVQRGGLVYYGGLIGASLACIIYVAIRKLALWKVADVLTPSIALGYVFGRIGCLLNGCCYGRSCSMPWAIRFPPAIRSPGGDLEEHETLGLPVHPTQIYDSLLNLALYFFLVWLFRRKKFDGQVFAAYLIAYAITRSIVESFRGDYTLEHVHGGLTPAHMVSIGIFASGLILMFVLRKLQRKPA